MLYLVLTQAIEVLERATRVRPTAQLFILLGKTNMKAKKFKNAIESFQKAIKIMVSELCDTIHPLTKSFNPLFI